MENTDKKRKLKVDISIAGTSASGKSTIAYIIKKALQDYDFKVNHEIGTDYLDEEHFNKEHSQHLRDRSLSIQNNSDIEINIKKNQIKKDLINCDISIELLKYGD